MRINRKNICFSSAKPYVRTIGLAVVAREREFKLIGGGSGKCGRMSKDGGGEGERQGV